MEYQIQQQDLERDQAKFYIEDDGKEAGWVRFSESEERVNIIETHVLKNLRGQGMAKMLVMAVVEYAGKQKKELSSDCPYASKVLERIN